MHALAGTSNKKDVIIPVITHTTPTVADDIITFLNDLHIRIDVSGGKIIRLDTKREPTSLIPITIVTAVKQAITILYAVAFAPVALEKFSSNVTANILL